ncbi:hypothetical protein FRC18_001085, partial [Serendipita sp. 400]
KLSVLAVYSPSLRFPVDRGSAGRKPGLYLQTLTKLRLRSSCTLDPLRSFVSRLMSICQAR